MKKVIIIISAVIAILAVITVNIYLNATKPVRFAEDEVVIRAKEKTNLETVADFQIYNGNETVYVIDGKDKEGTDIFVWVPEGDGPIIAKKQSEGISREQALQRLQANKDPHKIMSVRLGMEKNIPLWEISYRSEGDLLNYYLLDFETGEKELKIIENL